MKNKMIYPFEKIKWSTRTKKIAKHIPDDSIVIDLGAGKENLLNFIKPSNYYPVDKYRCTENTMVANFDLGQYPAIFVRGFVVVQGLIEYLENYKVFLHTIHQYGDDLIISYRTEVGQPGDQRHNSFSFAEFGTILGECGWKIVDVEKFSDKQFIFICKSTI